MLGEIEYVRVRKVGGMDMVMVSSAKSEEEGGELLSELGMRFEK